MAETGKPQTRAGAEPTADRVTNNSTPQTAKELKSDAVVEPGQQQVHDIIREEQEKGYRGEAADPTPNEHYTVAGVTDPNRHVPEEFKTQTGVTVWPEDVVKANKK